MLARNPIYMSIVVLILTSGGAIAEEAASEQNGGELEEIVVTAQKRQENLQKSSLALQVVSGAGVSDPKDLNGLVPGLQLAKNGSSVQIFIRGVGDPSTTELLGDQLSGSLSANVGADFASSRWGSVDFTSIARLPSYVRGNVDLTYAPQSDRWSLTGWKLSNHQRIYYAHVERRGGFDEARRNRVRSNPSHDGHLSFHALLTSCLRRDMGRVGRLHGVGIHILERACGWLCIGHFWVSFSISWPRGARLTASIMAINRRDDIALSKAA